MLKNKNIDINFVVDAIKNANRRCAFVIGAGCSKTAGIPMARELILDVKNKFPSLYAMIREKENYNAVMTPLAVNQRNDILKKYINKAQVNWAHLALAQLFTQNKIDRILTVNFDPLIIKACAILGETPAIYDLAVCKEFNRDQIADQSIFYLNGQYNGFSMLNTIEELEEHKENLRDIVEDTNRRRLWVIVGYSGYADPLLEILKCERFNDGLIWIGYDEEPTQNLHELLNKKHTHYLGGQDADKFMTKIAQELNCFPPDILTRPHRIIKKFLNCISFETGGASGEAVCKNIEKKIDIIEKENESSTEKEPWMQLMLQGKNSDVILKFEAEKFPSEKLTEAAFWSYINLGDNFNEEASKLADSEHDGKIKKLEKSLQNYKKATEIIESMRRKFFKGHKAYNNCGNALKFQLSYYRKLGNICAAKEKLEMAKKMYELSLEHEPEGYYAQRQLGGIYISEYHLEDDIEKKKQLLKEAEKILLKAEKNKPGAGAYNLACIAGLKGNAKKCVKFLRERQKHSKLPIQKHIEDDEDLDNIRTKSEFKVWLEETFPTKIHA